MASNPLVLSDPHLLAPFEPLNAGRVLKKSSKGASVMKPDAQLVIGAARRRLGSVSQVSSPL